MILSSEPFISVANLLDKPAEKPNQDSENVGLLKIFQKVRHIIHQTFEQGGTNKKQSSRKVDTKSLHPPTLGSSTTPSSADLQNTNAFNKNMKHNERQSKPQKQQPSKKQREYLELEVGEALSNPFGQLLHLLTAEEENEKEPPEQI